MSLLSLSNELLLEIASYFKYDSDINALMQTTGRLYWLLNTYLYRHNMRYFESSALKWAIRNGVAPVVQKMFDEGIPVNHCFGYSELIYLAISHQHESVVKVLLERGVDPDPKWWVCSNKKARREDKKAGRMAKGKYQAYGPREPPLNHALKCSSASVVRLLVSHVKTLRGEKAITGRHKQVPPGFEGLRIPRGVPWVRLMMDASRKGDPTVVGFLAKNIPPKLSEVEHEYNRCIPLVLALKRNHLEVIRVLLDADYDPNSYGDLTIGEVPLHFAIREGNIEAVHLLLENGARPDIAYKPHNENSLELLNQAAKWGNAAIAKLLLQYIIDIESKITSGHEEWDTLITTAATFGFMDIFQMILENNEASQGDKFALHNKYLRPPLSLAAERGHRDIVALLLDHGSDVHDGGMSTESYTPLLMAVSNGNTEIVKLLLDRSINFSLEGLYGSYEACPRDRVSLGTAALCYSTKFPAIFQLVLDAVDTISNPVESYILMVEVIISGNVELLQLLVNRGLRLGLDERHNVNLVKYAAKGGPDMLWALSSCGVIVLSPEDIDAQYSLCMAVYEGNCAVVDYFLGQGFDPNYIPPVFAGHSYMEIATRGKNCEAAAATLDALLHHGAKFDNMPGACTYDCECVGDDEQQLRAARLLLERGANPSPASTWGQNTLGIAVFKDHRKTIRLMLREICNRGIFFDNLDNVMHWIEKQVDDGKRDWQFWRIIENFYWRQVYPVPDAAMADVSDAMCSLVV